MSVDIIDVAEPFRETVCSAYELFGHATQLDPQQDINLELLPSLDQQLKQWQLLAQLATEKGLPALVDVITVFSESLQSLVDEKRGLTEAEWEWLDLWYGYSLVFFDNPKQFAALQDWLGCLPNLEQDDVAELIAAIEIDMTDFFDQATHDLLPQSGAREEYQLLETQEAQPGSETISELSVQANLVNLISTEFSFFVGELTEIIERSITCSSTAYQQALEKKSGKFRNLQQACATVGLEGLKQVYEFIQENIQAQANADIDFQQEAKLLKSSLLLIQDYLDHVEDPEKAKTLLLFLQMGHWRKPMTAQAAQMLSPLMTAKLLGNVEVQVERKIVKPEDFVLNITEDIDPELLESVSNELSVLAENFTRVVQTFDSEDAIIDNLLEAQRIAHTLKGTAGIAGIVCVTTLTHGLEDILKSLSENAVLPPAVLFELLQDSADCLASMCEALSGSGPMPNNAVTIAQSVLDWVYQIEKEGIPENDTILFDFSTNTPDEKNESTAFERTEAKENQANVVHTTVLPNTIDKLMRSLSEQNILNEQLKGKTDAVISNSKHIHNMTWQLHGLSAELDGLINVQNYLAKRSNTTTGEFDSLEMEQYGEMHSFVNRLTEMTADIREINIVMDRQLMDLKQALLDQAAMQKTDFDRVQEIMLTPVNKIIPRSQRIVRQTAKLTGKRVELKILGDETLVDSETLNQLAEPIMHLLRNAVDHGIEYPDQRIKADKPETGTITLEFSDQGNFIQINCSDDGKGLDYEKILQTAIAKKMLTESEIERLHENDINRLILTPGFSTRDNTTHISGRGIGMDVIHSHVKKCKGSMDLQSEYGQGLNVNIVLPVLIAAIRVILVEIGNTFYAISELGVKQIFSTLDGIIAEQDGDEFYVFQEKQYALEYLSNLINIPQKPTSSNSKKPGLLIEDRSGEKTVLIVDAVLDRKDVIVKSLGDYVPEIPGILGGAILGSGEVAPVLNLYELMSVKHEFHFQTGQLVQELQSNSLLRVLVADDSLSARKATSQLITDNGYEVQTAIDGLDALEKIECQQPDLIILDMEMPRMNGIELATHIRNREDLNDIPMMMITSRSTEKHRRQADEAGINHYLTKPYTEDDLINAVNLFL